MAFADMKNDRVFRRVLVPADLPPGPHREALELANKATFSQEELDAYQKVIDEIQQVRELAEAKWAAGKAEGIAEGHKSGLAEGKRDALLRLLARRAVVLTDDDRARIDACADVAILDQWFDKALVAKTAGEVFSLMPRAAVVRPRSQPRPLPQSRGPAVHCGACSGAGGPGSC